MRGECYMCNAAAVTKEHVPPRSFFPAGLRTGAVTVPSCVRHNLGNSNDVEYVRNVISTQHGVNDAAAEVFEVTKRSFDLSPRLMSRTFRDVRPISIDGDETGAFTIDLQRHRRVMRAIAYGLYFHYFGRKHHGDWQIFTPSFRHKASVYSGRPDPWDGFRALLESGHYVPLSVPHPAVFNCGAFQMEHGQMMFRLTFYERVVVNAWTQFRAFVQWSRN